ncbi:MAG: SIMPL domain-containing protein [Piscirickettsiaceae bacterium]|nr:SIMPL domain-containing protein [Piscirickettsiaceae bacterium]
MNKLHVLLLACLLSFTVTTANADDDLRYNQINLQASASLDTENDKLIAMLVVQENGQSPAILTKHVNQRMALILEKAVKFEDISTHTTSYNSRALYNKGKITSWQVSQNIKLTSQNFEQLSELVGELNDLANVQSMNFSVSDQTVERVKEQLTKEAISKFRSKASMIAKQFNEDSYRIIHVSIDSNSYQPQPMMARSMAMSEARGVPPTLSAGKNKISITVRGAIELISEH